MKSGKQRKAEIKATRLQRREARQKIQQAPRVPPASAPCNADNLAPYNSYGNPVFVVRGYYEDIVFCCKDCGVEETWRATQQKWWYEVAKGHVDTTATRCRPCRRRERERRAAAREVHLAGLDAKRRAQQS